MLTDRQEQFCKEYIIDLNATQAAIRAGYAAKSADANATRLMGNDGVKERIAELMGNRAKRTEVTADMIVQELALIAFMDIGDLVDSDGDMLDMEELKEQGLSRLIAEVSTVENTKMGTKTRILKALPKMQALKMLGDHLGMFKYNVDLTTKGKELNAPVTHINFTINHRKPNEKIEAQK